VDEVLMRFTDMMLVIPSLPLIIVLVAVLGPSLLNIIFVLGFLGWMGFARVIRSQVLSLRERPFIEAAKASGAGTGYITTKHIFPNIVSLTYVNLALSVPGAIVGEAALSFLGLGPQTVISWGQMLELAHGAATSAGLLWWWIIPPGIGIAVLSLSFILIGYALDEMFNPRLRKRH
jgi:peptide/nickel transport system permease protein